MNKFFNKKFSLTIVAATTVIAAVIASNKGSFKFNAAFERAVNNEYGFILNEENAYQGGTSQSVESISTYANVNLSYTDCSVNPNGHVTINPNGSVKTLTPVSSMYTMNATFTGPLEFRTSYDGTTWSPYSICESGKDYFFKKEVAYVELFANQHAVSLDNLEMYYACEPVASANEKVDTSSVIDSMPIVSQTGQTYIYTTDDKKINFLGSYVYYSPLQSGTGTQQTTIDRIAFPSATAYIANYDPLELTSLLIKAPAGGSYSFTVYTGTTRNPTTNAKAITVTSTGVTVTVPTGNTYFSIKSPSIKGKSLTYLDSITVTYKVPAVDPAGIELLPNNYEIKPGTIRQTFVDYYPQTTNRNKGVTFTSTNPSVATVDTNGVVTVNASAPVGATFDIVATSTYDSRLVSTATMNVVADKLDEWTLMVYMCGSDLESNGAEASLDLLEMCEMYGQPEDVNIFIFTGGSPEWALGLDGTKNYFLTIEEGQLYILNAGLTEYMPMGDPQTLFTFMDLAIENFPAKRYGLILWNHGGAMQGVCYDDVDTEDEPLLNSETELVFKALTQYEVITEKMEFIGYDACLMGVQDIMYKNSKYFNYMIASEESEAGYGWDYDEWFDDLYANKDTPRMLRSICDSFVDQNNLDGSDNANNDQTLAFYDLSKAEAYYQAFESFAGAFVTKLGSTSKTTVLNFMKTCKRYAVDNSGSDLAFGVVDIIDFLNKVSANSTFNPGASYVNAVKAAFEQLVTYSYAGLGAGESYGMTLFYAFSANADQGYYYDEYETDFANWRAFNAKFGY